MHNQPFNQIKTWSYFYSNWSGGITLEMDHKGHYYKTLATHKHTYVSSYKYAQTSTCQPPNPQTRSLLKCDLLSQSFSDHPFQSRNTHTHTTLSPFPTLFFSMVLITIWILYIYTFTCLFIIYISHWNIRSMKAGNFDFFQSYIPYA